MTPRITLTLLRADLEAEDACEDGLALYDELSDGAESITLEWTLLAQLWLARDCEHAGWLRDVGLIPAVSAPGAYLGGAYLGGAYLGGAYLRGADLGGAYLRGAYLRGADLRGAWRWSDDPAVPGWRRVDGRLQREVSP